ncbi:Cytochrome P450 B-class protein [Dioscorea alata]|uniref:Cytochrome P450 B-class protein n=1 Tax=Dioscorea alata TaxID=55571 RepID=A0ACB7UWB5_DIOAL|nr:Cytochrome P450 B-class protein [Dioscorea alata]
MQPHSSSSLGLFINQNIAKHGRIFKMNLLGKPTIVSANADFNRYILQSEGRMFINSCPTSIAEILGRWSMLALEGDIHKEMRSIAVNFMSNAKLRTYFLPDIEQQALKILNSWKVGSTFSALVEGKKFAFNLMVKHLMSMNPGLPETEKLRKEYNTFMNGMASMPLNLPFTSYRKALQSRSVILKIMGRCLDERVEKIRDGCNGLEKDDLLASVSAETNLTRDQILDLILSMLFAGHETSSAAICLAIYFLESSPKALQQLREEHEYINRMKSESGLTWDDYKQMEFTQCVINETLRLGNIVKFLHRKTIKDVQYKGYDIPCGWEVVPIISAAHLDSNIYDDPQTYNPWRWQNTSMAKSKNNSIMSFSGGPRMCPGAELSKMEMAVFLHHLVLKFNWELVEHDYPVSFPFLGFPKNLPIKVHAIKQN